MQRSRLYIFRFDDLQLNEIIQKITLSKYYLSSSAVIVNVYTEHLDEETFFKILEKLQIELSLATVTGIRFSMADDPFIRRYDCTFDVTYFDDTRIEVLSPAIENAHFTESLDPLFTDLLQNDSVKGVKIIPNLKDEKLTDELFSALSQYEGKKMLTLYEEPDADNSFLSSSDYLVYLRGLDGLTIQTGDGSNNRQQRLFILVYRK